MDKAVPAREPWSSVDHAAAVNSAIEAAALLSDRARTIMRVRLAALLIQSGETAAAARVLHDTVDDLYRPGAPLHDLGQRLVEVGAIDDARKLAAGTSDTGDRRQVLSGMIDGAIKAGNLDVASQALGVARRLPHSVGFDPFVFQAKTLAVALAKIGHYRQALAAFPTSPISGPDLPRIATQACAADPSIADQAGAVLAVVALRAASNTFVVNAPVEEIRAFTACKGEAAAKRLIAIMPADIAAKVSAEAAVAPSGGPNELAADAFKASRNADEAKADQLFAAATAKLDAAAPSRGTSREARQRFDNSTSQVAVWMTQAKRPEAAVAIVAKLPPLERLPILFTLAQTAVRGFVDPTIFLAPIGTDFSVEPALIDVEAAEIRALRGALPLGSPVYAQIEPWLDRLPAVTEPAPAIANRVMPNRIGDQLKAILAAFEVAAPSVIVVRRALVEATHGNVAQAIVEAKSLTLTPRETGTVELIRSFIAALPEDLLTPTSDFELNGLRLSQGLTATPTDSLLVVVERAAVNVGDLDGARNAFASID